MWPDLHKKHVTLWPPPLPYPLIYNIFSCSCLLSSIYQNKKSASGRLEFDWFFLFSTKEEEDEQLWKRLRGDYEKLWRRLPSTASCRCPQPPPAPCSISQVASQVKKNRSNVCHDYAYVKLSILLIGFDFLFFLFFAFQSSDGVVWIEFKTGDVGFHPRKGKDWIFCYLICKSLLFVIYVRLIFVFMFCL